MKKQIEESHKEIEDRCAQVKVDLQLSKIHQKIEGSLKAIKKKILELQ
jgi:putative component of toxin-antitoxin plasmid stabilization module